MNKIRILFLAANPQSTKRLKLDEEVKAITEKIRASEHRDLLELVPIWAVRPDDILQSLNVYRPHIVHFSSHGSPTGEIILVDRDESPKRIDVKAIKALFRTLKDNIQVVVLNACYSRVQATAITQVIDCAIGMKGSIGDQAAITFAASFYRAIGFRRSIQEAFEQGKTSLMLEGISEENKPELLVKKGVDPSLLYLVELPLTYDHHTFQLNERNEAVIAFRSELQLNLGWLDDILESRNYLRDQAWVTLKNKGYISFLPIPIPRKAISVYDKLYQVNEQIRMLREDDKNFNREKAEESTDCLSAEILKIIELFDTKYSSKTLTSSNQQVEKRDERIEAVAAFRFELELNLSWLDNILKSRNYLRDGAWVILKNKGYISFLPTPIPRKAISVYDKLYQVNEQIRMLREDDKNFNREKAERDIWSLSSEIIRLNKLLDVKYPEIGNNIIF